MSGIKKFLRKFKENKRGIIWVWAVVMLAMVIYAIAWFTLGWAAMEVISTVENAYTFEEPASNTVDLFKTVFAWHPVIVIFGWILYGYVNSQRRDVRVYED